MIYFKFFTYIHIARKCMTHAFKCYGSNICKAVSPNKVFIYFDEIHFTGSTYSIKFWTAIQSSLLIVIVEQLIRLSSFPKEGNHIIPRLNTSGHTDSPPFCLKHQKVSLMSLLIVRSFHLRKDFLNTTYKIVPALKSYNTRYQANKFLLHSA